MALSPSRIWFPTFVLLILLWISKVWFQLPTIEVLGVSLIIVAVAFALTAIILGELKKLQRDAWISAVVCLLVGFLLLFAKQELPLKIPNRSVHVQNIDYQIYFAGFSLQEGCDSQEEDCPKGSFSVGRIVLMISLGIVIAIFFRPEKGPRGQIPPF